MHHRIEGLGQLSTIKPAVHWLAQRTLPAVLPPNLVQSETVLSQLTSREQFRKQRGSSADMVASMFFFVCVAHCSAPCRPKGQPWRPRPSRISAVYPSCAD